MSKEQRSNKEKKKPKAVDKNAPKSGGSAYKQAQSTGPSANPFAKK